MLLAGMLRMEMQRKPVGKVSHYFDKIGVAVVDLTADLKVGDKIQVEGHGKSFEQTVSTLQMEKTPLQAAKKGQSVGMKCSQKCKPGDVVYKVG